MEGLEEISALPLASPHFRPMMEAFLASCGLRPEPMDAWYCISADDGSILAGAGISGNTVKCVAVDERHRGEGLLPRLISHIISLHQGENLRVFTKPEYRALFEDLGFKLLAQAPEAVLLENGRGLDDYLKQISRLAGSANRGVIVMNANPFTNGHRYLVEKALEKVQHVVIIPVKEEAQEFTYEERREMIQKGCEGLPVTVAEGSDYSISALTFPTYFLKDLSMAAETQMRLDLDLFARHIVPALGSTVRFVGTEPEDSLTARYNAIMKDILPIPVEEIERLPGVSGSRVRGASYPEAVAMCPASSHPYLLARLMHKAMLAELDTPMKPGLVGPDSPGAHSDMDYALMWRGAAAVRRGFTAHIGLLPDLVAFGKAIEADALDATGGVNTHRGAIFALGLTAVAAIKGADIAALAAGLQQPEGTHGAEAKDAKGALRMAQGGYRELFTEWLPYYRSLEGDTYRMQKTLLKIMSSLDDTCVIHRVGAAWAQEIKLESRNLLEDFSVERLQETTNRYNAGRVSPGGSADMLALTVLADKLT